MKTFGRLAFKNCQWFIDCEPHVVLKLKRVFPKVSRRNQGTIRLTDTAEICRELDWFMQRYPLEFVDEASKVRLRERSSEHRDRENEIASLISGVRVARPFPLALPPRDYQRVAAEMTLAVGGLLLADDLGLGKTCSAICVISEPAARPALVVTLTHLPRQWQNEINKFCPGLSTHIVKKGTPYDITKGGRTIPGQCQLHGTNQLPDVIIINYAKLAGWAETLGKIVRSVVFDEAQELRRDASNKSSAARHIASCANYRMGLTATPIYNYGDEIFNVIDAVRPGAMGSRSEFIEEWCTSQDSHGRSRIREPKAFGTYARDAGFMLRRTRSDVGRELPALTRVAHHVDCDMERLQAIESSATELARVILSQNPTARGEKFKASEELSILVRQATGIAKAPFVADFVRMVVETGERVLLYGWHREVYSIWMDKLSDFNPVMYTGSESPSQKEMSKQAFMSGETPILIMSLRAGAGLDGLQSCCRTIVHGELDYSPGVHEQCDGRIHRDGQGEPVVSYYLITDSGSDPIVADILNVKGEQIRGIRDPNVDLVEKLQGGGDHVRRLAEAYLSKERAA